MKSFTKLYSDFWVNYGNSEVIKLGADVQLLALYLQANSHHNILGAYYLPLLYIASDLKLPVKQVQATLNKLCKINYCKYDKETQYIWVYNLAHEQIGEKIDIKDNRTKSLHAVWDSLPSRLDFLEEIHQKYNAAFHLKPRIPEKSLDLSSYLAKEAIEIKKPQKSQKNPKNQKTEVETVVTDLSLGVVQNTDTNISIDANIDTSTDTSINHYIHTTLDTQPPSDESLPILISPFEAPPELLETPNEGIDGKADGRGVCKNNLLATPSELAQKFINDYFDTQLSHPVTPVTCQILLGEETIETCDSVLTPSKGLRLPFKAPSKPLQYPSETPSDDLQSPSKVPSETLQSNIEYRIKNIENRNKKEEIEDRRKKRKEKTKKRDIYLNHVPNLNIVAQARPCQSSTESSFESNCLALQLQPSKRSGDLKPMDATEIAETIATTKTKARKAETTETVETNKIAIDVADAEYKSSTCKLNDLPAITTASITTKTPITAEVSLESNTVAKNLSKKETKVADSVFCSIPATSAVYDASGVSDIFDVSVSEIPDASGTADTSDIPSISSISDISNVFDAPTALTIASHNFSSNFVTSDATSTTSHMVQPKPTVTASADAVTIVFEHWKNTMRHPNSKLDCKRSSLIRKALRIGYNAEQLCEAITGCSITPHNIGHNERGQRYDGLHVILGDADQIDRFIRNYHHPPRPITKAHQRLQANVSEVNDWLREKLNESTNETNNINELNNSRGDYV